MMLRRWMRVGRQRLRSLFRRRAADDELSRELRFHLDQLVSEHVAAGLPQDQARLLARRELGNLPLLEEQCRDERRVRWLHDAVQDVQYAGRQFVRDKRAVAVIVLTLALGVGVNTAVYSIVGGFRRPLPVPAAEQIVVLAAQVDGDERGARYKLSHAALEDLRRGADDFSDLFGFSLELTGVTVGGRPSQFLYSAVTGNYFSALGVTPALGRFFVPGEGERPGNDSVLVLAYRFWQRQFGGDPNVVGRQVRIGGSLARIIGVAPESFHGTFSGADMDGYLPLNALRVDPSARDKIFTDRTARWLTVLGRLKPGVSLAQAQAAMTLAARRLERQHPDVERGIGIRLVPETRARPDPVGLLQGGSDRAAEMLLLGLAGLVLLLACLNVANLLLVRSIARQREMAVRAALGSGRGRLIRQVLAETLLLSLFGAAAGMLLGHAGSRAFEQSIDLGPDFPFLLDFGFDWRVYLYGMTAAVLSASVIAIWPAIRASRTNAMESLHDGARGDSGGRGGRRVRSLLAAGQIAGSLVLLTVAALFVRDLRNAEQLDLGFTPDHVLNLRMDPQWAGYDPAATNEFYRELERQTAALPGVQATSYAYSVPLGYYGDGATVHIEGQPEDPDQQPPMVPFNYVGPGYFATMQMRIVRGRAFTDHESAVPVAIINGTMADRFWPHQDALGKRFRIEGAGGPALEIVGIAVNSKYVNIFEAPQPYFYVPLEQYYKSMRVLQVRSSTPAERLGPRIRELIAAIGPDVPVASVQTMRGALSGFGGFMLLRIAAFQAGALGLLGLLLAVIGVYGVASYAAAQRTREIGIRIALGAASRDVLRLVLGQGTLMVAGGIAAGLVGATGTAMALMRVLRMESALDPLVFGGVTIALGAIALGACLLPARRVTRILPTEALRQE